LGRRREGEFGGAGEGRGEWSRAGGREGELGGGREGQLDGGRKEELCRERESCAGGRGKEGVVVMRERWVSFFPRQRRVLC
jgi:hypothetical protein